MLIFVWHCFEEMSTTHFYRHGDILQLESQNQCEYPEYSRLRVKFWLATRCPFIENKAEESRKATGRPNTLAVPNFHSAALVFGTSTS